MRTLILTVPVLIAVALPAQEPVPDRPDANARVRTLLTRLGARDAMRFTCSTRNLAYEETLRQNPGRARRNYKRFRIWGVRAGQAACWVAEEAQPADPQKAERHLLARSGSRWLVKDGASAWQRCQRPAAAWSSAHLPDPVFLAETLTELLPTSKWEAGAENIDEKMVRVYRLKLEGEAVASLIRRGVVPESADVASGLGTVGREYLGRTVRRPERSLVIRIHEDPKEKLPVRFVVELWQASSRTATFARVVRLGGGAPAPKDPARKGADEKKDESEKKPFLRMEITLHDIGTAKLDVLDAGARSLLERR